MAPGIPHPLKQDLKDLFHNQAASAEYRVDPKPGVEMTHRGVRGHLLVEVRQRTEVRADLIILARNAGPQFGQFIQRLLRALPHEQFPAGAEAQGDSGKRLHIAVVQRAGDDLPFVDRLQFTQTGLEFRPLLAEKADQISGDGQVYRSHQVQVGQPMRRRDYH